MRLQVTQDIASPRYNRSRQAGQFPHGDPVTLVRGSFLHPVKKNKFFTPLPDGDIEVIHALTGQCQLRQFVVVGRKKGPATTGFSFKELFGHSPGDTYPVEGTRSTSDLIQDNKTFSGGVVKDLGSLHHLHHESGQPLG